MARGLDRHQARQNAVSAMGKVLSRRARNRCELCRTRTSLKVIEVGPLEEEPQDHRAILVCGSCEKLITGGVDNDNEVRFLSEAVWSEALPVQLTAVRLVKRLADDGVGWAVKVIDGLYLDPEVEAQL